MKIEHEAIDKSLFSGFDLRRSTLEERIEMAHRFRSAENNLTRAIPDYILSDESLIFEADVQYTGPASYAAIYDSTPDVRENLIYPIVISRFQSSSSHFTKRNDWNCYQLIVTIAGSAVMNAENQILTLRPGSIYLLDCRPYHYFYVNDPAGWDYFMIHFDGGQSTYFYSLLKEKGLYYEDMSDSRAMHLAEKISLASQDDDPSFELSFHVWMTELLSSLLNDSVPLSASPVLPSWFVTVRRYIDEHYNQRLHVEDLASMSYLSTSRFTHRFKELSGLSPIQYQRQIRILHAKLLLESTNLSVSEIAVYTGFQNDSNFFDAFHQATGISPGKYRKQHT